MGERCVLPDPAVPDSYVCQAPEVSKCQYNSQCMTLFCASDGQCRNECATVTVKSADCPFARGGARMDCAIDPVNMVNFCVDPVADATTYDPATLTIIPQANNGGAMGSAGAGGSGGVGHGGTGGPGAGGKGGKAGSSCFNPQIAFGNVAQGDANPYFVNGVAARVDGRILIFSAYVGPPVALGAGGASGAGGAGGTTVNYVYVQAFDASTGVAAGPAAPLFQAADGTNFGVWTAAVSSTGEVVLVWGTGPINGNHNSLSASFLSTSRASALGAQLEKTVLIESAELGNVGAFWSETNQEFVLSWKYNTNGWQIRTKKFASGGTPAGGDTNAVALTQPALNGADHSVGVGSSGHLFAAAYRDPSNGYPALTLLDADGNTVGMPMTVGSSNLSPWITVAGTSKGFVTLFQQGSVANGIFIPKLPGDSGIVIPSAAGGAGGGDGAGGASGGAWIMFSVPSTATAANVTYSISDELGAGGVGTVYRETNGASFLYVTADGAKHYASTVLSSSQGGTVSITNYLGSFSVSLYEVTKHATQAAASGCTP